MAIKSTRDRLRKAFQNAEVEEWVNSRAQLNLEKVSGDPIRKRRAERENKIQESIKSMPSNRQEEIFQRIHNRYPNEDTRVYNVDSRNKNEAERKKKNRI